MARQSEPQPAPEIHTTEPATESPVPLPPPPAPAPPPAPPAPAPAPAPAPNHLHNQVTPGGEGIVGFTGKETSVTPFGIGASFQILKTSGGVLPGFPPDGGLPNGSHPFPVPPFAMQHFQQHPPGVPPGPVPVQRQYHIPQQQQQQQQQLQQQQRVTPFICVPNKQAPYPTPQARLGAAKGLVVRHMTTSGGAPAQALQHQKFLQRPPHAAVYSQAQLASTSGPPPPQMPQQQQQHRPVNHRGGQVRPPGQPGKGQQHHPVQHKQPSPRGGQPGKQPGHSHRANGPPMGKPPPAWLAAATAAAQVSKGGPSSNDHKDFVVNVYDRKIRLASESDDSSLYSLLRRWVRNDVPRKDQVVFWDAALPLPTPLTAEEAEKLETPAEQNGESSSNVEEETELETPADELSKEELLEHHLIHFKNVRKRSSEQRLHKIARFRQRLALLLPPA